MTPDETIAAADLMRRYAESVKAGKPITLQCKSWSNGEWNDIVGIVPWSHAIAEYREKPREPREPRRWKIGIMPNGIIHTYNDQCCEFHCYSEVVEVVEVLCDSPST
jgi:hypothetical protein